MSTAAALVPVMLLFAAMVAASAADAQQLGPTRISKCQAIAQPGSYRLANNLQAAGNCLVVTARGVTIDLAGFAIVGNGTGTAITAKDVTAGSIPQARTVVRNGEISNFAAATNLSGTVEGLRVVSNARGIVVGVGTVRNNIVQFNSSAGIEIADGIVTGNLLIGNDIGICVEEAGVVTGNQAAGNKIGIEVKGAGSTLVGNIADGNSEIGMRVACPSNLIDNTAIGNPRNLVLKGQACRNDGNLAP